MSDEQALRKRHYEHVGQSHGAPKGRCVYDALSWPCDTIAALDIADAERALADRLAEALIECEQGHHGEHCVDQDISWRECDWWGHKDSAVALAAHAAARKEIA